MRKIMYQLAARRELVFNTTLGTRDGELGILAAHTMKFNVTTAFHVIIELLLTLHRN